jgi:methanogenic corrinoid protein MtbC1/DNA-binding XRE family transcriptional regulator
MKIVESRGHRGPTERYMDALLAGDEDGTSTAVAGVLADGASIADVYGQVLTPAMVKIGDLWRARKVNVAQQKLATQITLSQMDKLRSLGAASQKWPYRALVCCIQGEMHSTGARMIADLFGLEGWAVDFLGADVPTEDILTMVKHRRPQILALSITMKANLKQVRRLLEVLGKLPEKPKVLIGGQATAPLNQWKVKESDFNVARDLMDGLNIALSAFRSAKPRADLGQYLKEIGQRIRELRTLGGHTQAQLAQSAGLNRAYIVSVESGKQNISMGVVVKIANALGVSVQQLLVA